MKKSEMYKTLQIIVMDEADRYMGNDLKLETLRELMAQEDLARFSEEQAAKANETAEARL